MSPHSGVLRSTLPDLLADLEDAQALDLAGERDELIAKVERVRELHYAADNTPGREPICEHCHGAAGHHPCGCWSAEDRQPVCGHCYTGWKSSYVDWPCPTIRALDPESEVHP